MFMGMGEPLMNLDAALAACERLPDVGIAHSHTGVSTVGWIPGIDRMAEEGPPVRLALSLHAADEALRSELMPVNDRYPLRDVLDACLRWHDRRSARCSSRPDAGRRERPLRAGPGARRPAGASARLQGEPDPVQPD